MDSYHASIDNFFYSLRDCSAVPRAAQPQLKHFRASDFATFFSALKPHQAGRSAPRPKPDELKKSQDNWKRAKRYEFGMYSN